MTNREERPPHIELRGVRVHNLQNIDLDIPLRKLVVITGVSGAGKSSLAFDTLYAEGQRRYVESFSTYARRFLERFEKPDADRIEPIPPAVAVRQKAPARSRRATVGTATEIYDLLQLLLARAGLIECPGCGRRVERHTPASAQRALATLEPGTRFMVCFPIAGALRLAADSRESTDRVWPGLQRSEAPEGEQARRPRPSHSAKEAKSQTKAPRRSPGLPSGPTLVTSVPAPATHDASTPVSAGASGSFPEARALQVATLIEAGFTRLIDGEHTVVLADITANSTPGPGALVVVDRLTAGTSTGERLADSLETAFRHGDGACVVLVARSAGGTSADVRPLTPGPSPAGGEGGMGSQTDEAFGRRVVDGVEYDVLTFNSQLICPGCGTEYIEPEPALFNFNSPLGACPQCRGTGEIISEPAVDQAPVVCPACRGARLRPEALAVRVAGRTIAEFTRLTADELLGQLAADAGSVGHVGDAASVAVGQVLSESQLQMAAQILPQATSRLHFLIDVGLGYLTLDRPARTLSAGEAQRVRLTAAFGSKFVNMLYVLDEPTSGLHPHDTERLLAAIQRLRDAGNTVVVVEHDAALIRQADQVVEIGPGAGKEGGRVMFQGTPQELLNLEQSPTADFLAGRRQVVAPGRSSRRSPKGWLRLAGVEHHNLHDVAVAFPLGVLCVVSGVSGSGKSSLVLETLYPAVIAELQSRAGVDDEVASGEAAGERARKLLHSSRSAVARQAGVGTGKFSSLTGLDRIDDVLLIDHSPIGRSVRANPASFLNLFGEIRMLFAGTAEAKVKNFSARHFSFNSAGGGRCETCRGAGTIAVDMQFLPDVVTTCPDCHGTRYRREILEARYRGLSIAEVLNLTVRDAFPFFRGRTRLQRRLKVLKDVGLDYMTLGQPADTLSGGESQRLKLAAFLSRAGRARTLFIVDEPTTGLHPADIVRLLDSLGQLLAGGHSLIVIEHNLDFLRSADYIIDLGPGAGSAGGQLVAAGTLEEIVRVPQSVTGEFLK